MKKVYSVALLLGLSILCADLASAGIIVDTGTSGIYDNTVPHLGLNSDKFQAGKFTLVDAVVLESIETFLGGNNYSWQAPHSVGLVTAAIYTNENGIPGQELYSRQFSVEKGAVGWFGTFGNSWELSAGTYWVSMEVRSSDFFYGFLASNALTPMESDGYAYRLNPTADHVWRATNYGGSTSGPAWRLLSPDEALLIPDQSPVPEPATMLLFGTGLSGMAFYGRRKQS